jgi:hypothetical protein
MGIGGLLSARVLDASFHCSGFARRLQGLNHKRFIFYYSIADYFLQARFTRDADFGTIVHEDAEKTAKEE